MRRSVVILCAVLLGLLAFPRAAFAKGAEAATIDGDVLWSPIRMRGDGIPTDSPPLWKIADRAGFWAAKGPVTFTAAGQTVFDMKTVGGWFQADPRLKDMLVELGIPAKAPKVATDPATNTASTAASASSSINWWLIASVTALAIAAGTAALWLRTRASIA